MKELYLQRNSIIYWRPPTPARGELGLQPIFVNLRRFCLKSWVRAFKCFYFSKTRRHPFYVLRNLHTLSPRITGFHISRINSYANTKINFCSSKKGVSAIFGSLFLFMASEERGWRTSPQELRIAEGQGLYCCLVTQSCSDLLQPHGL